MNARRFIDNVFSDTSVPPETTAARLWAIIEACNENLAALREDGVDIAEARILAPDPEEVNG